jgi:hypothetical protein
MFVMNATSQTDAVDFKGLILGFSGAAMHYLGESVAPGESPVCNMSLAHQNIEILALLAEKTKGNLSDEEESLLRQLLIDLRMRFIEKSRKSK